MSKKRGSKSKSGFLIDFRCQAGGKDCEAARPELGGQIATGGESACLANMHMNSAFKKCCPFF